MIVSARGKQRQQLGTTVSPEPLPLQPRRVETLPSPQTSELMQPTPSVTEGTTRHLGAEAPTRIFDALEGGEKPS